MELKDWLPNALAALGIIATIVIASKQVIQEKKHEIRVALFEKLIDRLVETSAATSASSSMVYLCGEVLERSLENKDIYTRHKPIDFHDANQRTTKDLTALIFAIESHEIVLPKSKLLVEKLTSKGNELGYSFSSFFSSILPHLFMVTTGSPGGPIREEPANRPSADQVAEIKKRAKEYCDLSNDVSMYLKDVMTEAQNLLLGPIFGGKVEPRKPLDPKYAPLKLDS